MKHTKSQAEVVVFNGIKFRRYPDGKSAALRNYFWPGISHAKKGVGSLHVEVWKSINGPVPEKHHIHHVDGNTLNNQPDNLECLTPEEHSQKHFKDPDRLAQARRHIENIRPLASAWHKSPEGKEFHQRLGKLAWEGREATTKTCTECGKEFATLYGGEVLFCSGKCSQKARRTSGVDNIELACAMCSKPFVTNRYHAARTCSRSCAYVSRQHFQKRRPPKGSQPHTVGLVAACISPKELES